MAIFNNSDITPKSSPSDSSTTIITQGAKITGELDLTCSLYIDGSLDGIIRSTSEVNIGKNGFIKGNISAERLIVQGLVEGMIDAKSVVIKAHGHVSGEISSSELIIESKGVFEGNSIIKTSDNQEKKVEIQQQKD